MELNVTANPTAVPPLLCPVLSLPPPRQALLLASHTAYAEAQNMLILHVFLLGSLFNFVKWPVSVLTLRSHHCSLHCYDCLLRVSMN